MYCPKCKENVKPGTEKMEMHKAGQTMCAVGVGGLILGPFLLGTSALTGWIFIIGGLIFGFANRQAVCPACKKALLPENPFSDP